MTAIHETAYPRIKPCFSYSELQEIFTPSEEELAFLNKKTKRTLSLPRLGFMLTLKCYQYLGRPIQLKKIEDSIKKFVGNKLGIETEVDLNRYDSSARKRHIKLIREYLQINADKKVRRQTMKAAALNAAETKENLADIINSIIDELIKSKFQLPAFKRLVRLARAARTVVSNGHYTTLVNALTDEQKTFIDTMIGLIKPEIVEEKQANGIFTWAKLKTEPKKPTHNNIKSYIAYVKQLTAIRERFNINLDFILPARLEALKEEALIADIDDMKAMRPLKRYALAVILIELKASAAIDDLIQVFIAWIKGIEANAKSKLEMYRIAQASKTDSHILLLYNLNSTNKCNSMPSGLG